MKAQTMWRVRRFHHYVGVFFAPAILFFALSGAIQTIGLQETRNFGPPPHWITWMASVHTHQTPPRPHKEHHHDEDASSNANDATKHSESSAAAEKKTFVPLKIFVLLLAIGLILSTVLGLTVALSSRETRRISLIVFAAGLVVPLLLMLA